MLLRKAKGSEGSRSDDVDVHGVEDSTYEKHPSMWI